MAVIEGDRALDPAKLDRWQAAFASVACWFRDGGGAGCRTLKLLEQANNQPDLWQPLDSIRYAALVAGVVAYSASVSTMPTTPPRTTLRLRQRPSLRGKE